MSGRAGRWMAAVARRGLGVGLRRTTRIADFGCSTFSSEPICIDTRPSVSGWCRDCISRCCAASLLPFVSPPWRPARSSASLASAGLGQSASYASPVTALAHRRTHRSTMASALVNWDRLHDDVVQLIFERVGPPNMFNPSGVRHPRLRGQLVPAQRDLVRFRCLSRRLGSIAGDVASQHLGPSMRARATLIAQ